MIFFLHKLKTEFIKKMNNNNNNKTTTKQAKRNIKKFVKTEKTAELPVISPKG